MALERTYVIPLRKEWLKAPRYKRSKKAIKAIMLFLQKHMKAEFSNIKLLPELNEFVWKHGIKNPPGKVSVNVSKDDKGIVTVQLVGKAMPKQEEKKKGVAAKLKEKVVGKKEEKKEVKKEEKAKPVEKKEEKKEETKKEEKPAEKKEEKKEEVKQETKEQKPDSKP